MDTPLTETDDGALAGMSYVLQEEAQLAQVWSAQDQAEHQRGEQEIATRFSAARLHLDGLHARVEALWERFVSLALERILSQRIREFLEEIDGEMQALIERLTEIDCEVDRIRARVHDRRRVLAEKITVLEPLAHRTSTQNYLEMMLARVEGLEAYLLGRKDVPAQAYDLHYKRHTNASGDLAYLRVRLLTTRTALNAANRSRQFSQFDATLTDALLQTEQLKTELSALSARLECMSELSRYWLMYLDIVLAQGA